MALLFNTLSRFVIGFLPRSKHLLISPSAVILEPKKIKCVTASTFSPSICHEVMGPRSVLGGGVLVAKFCPALATPWTVTWQTPLSMGFPRQEYWRWLPFTSPGDLSNPGIEPGSPALQLDSLLTELRGKSLCLRRQMQKKKKKMLWFMCVLPVFSSIGFEQKTQASTYKNNRSIQPIYF